MVDRETHDCRNSMEEEKATLRKPYHFAESGLPNVYLVGVKYRVCKVCGAQSADIPAIKNLMKALGRIIVESKAPLTGAEIRFLRKRLGKKSSEFARIIGVTTEQVSRWENGHNPPERSADKLIRIFYCHLAGDKELRAGVDKKIEQWLSAWSLGEPLISIRARLSHRNWQAQPVPSTLAG